MRTLVIGLVLCEDKFNKIILLYIKNSMYMYFIYIDQVAG